MCTAMLLNDINNSRLMVYAQQIEESKIREIRQEGKRPWLDDSSNQKHTNRRLASGPSVLSFGGGFKPEV